MLVFALQVERKRHIGNDIVNIIFVDGDCCDFTPNCIKSQFTRILFHRKMYFICTKNCVEDTVVLLLRRQSTFSVY